MDWITDQIAIGNYLDALDVELIRGSGLASALSLDGTLHGKEPADFGLRRIETVMLEDAPGIQLRIDSLVKDLFDEDDAARQKAAETLGEIGPNAQKAIPALAVLLKDRHSDLSTQAAVALIKIGMEAVPVLVDALQAPNDEIRYLAAWALGNTRSAS